MCCYVFPPAHVFPRSLGNIAVTEMGGSPFSHGGTVLNLGRCPTSGVAVSPTADVDVDAGITGIVGEESPIADQWRKGLAFLPFPA